MKLKYRFFLKSNRFFLKKIQINTTYKIFLFENHFFDQTNEKKVKKCSKNDFYEAEDVGGHSTDLSFILIESNFQLSENRVTFLERSHPAFRLDACNGIQTNINMVQKRLIFVYLFIKYVEKEFGPYSVFGPILTILYLTSEVCGGVKG